MIKIEYQVCTRCNVEKPKTSEFYYRQKVELKGGEYKYTLPSPCKTCRLKYQSKYQKKHSEAQSVRRGRYYQENREKELEYGRNYKRKHKKKLRKQMSKWRRSDRGKEKHREYNAKRYNRNHSINGREWASCKKYFNYKCAYCEITYEEHKKIHNQDLHKEHVDPNGSNNLSNCVPSCRICNSSKRDFEFSDWYNEDNPNYTVEMANKILQWLNEDYKLYINEEEN